MAADLDAAYLPFVTPARQGPDVPSLDVPSLDVPCRDMPCPNMWRDVPVDVLLERAPVFDGATPLFETGHAWTMHARGRERFFFHQGPRRDTPLWTAGFPLGVERVTVWCDPEAWRPAADGAGVSSPLRYPLDQILVMYSLARLGGLLVHATGVVVEGRALVCCGVSGAGKSTLARLLAAAGEGDLLSDDRVIIRRDSGRRVLRAHGTPWPGDARVAVNGSAPLGALVFLRHGPENRITPLSPTGALHRLLPVASIPWFDADVLPAALAVCDELVGAVPAFELEFRPEPAAAEMVGGLLRARVTS